MKVSIVTVTFNSAATLADALLSVATQTHRDIEHIVIDGGSTDETMAIVRAYGAHLTKIVSERDGGIYDAMNKGLALASGDYVGFLNGDDMLASHQTIEALVAAASASGGAPVDVIYGDLMYVRKDETAKVVRHWVAGRFSRQALRQGWMPPHPTFYVRRDLQRRVGKFDTRLRISADYDFMLRCLRSADVRTVYVPQVLVLMRTGGASNRSIRALLEKSRQDLIALRRNGVGGWFSLACKNLRKIPQFFGRLKASA